MNSKLNNFAVVTEESQSSYYAIFPISNLGTMGSDPQWHRETCLWLSERETLEIKEAIWIGKGANNINKGANNISKCTEEVTEQQ